MPAVMEAQGVSGAEPETTRHVTNRFTSRAPAPYGAEHLADHTLNARRRFRAKAQDDVDIRRDRPSPAPRDVAIDLRPEAAMSRRRLLLRFACPAVGPVGRRVRDPRPGLDPVVGSCTIHHGDTSHGSIRRMTAQARLWPTPHRMLATDVPEKNRFVPRCYGAHGRV